MPLVRKPVVLEAVAQPDASRILQSLQSHDADERWSAARAASGVAEAEVVLGRALRVETDARVREAMLTSLSRLGTPAAVAPLIAMVRTGDAASRTAALDALRLTPILSQIIEKLLQDTDADVRLLCCDLTRSLPAPQANVLLVTLLNQEAQANVCAAAIEVLAEVGGPEVLDSVNACAARFSDDEFLRFAIRMVIDRLEATAAGTRV
jgi:HEAT repeat protein